MAQAGPLRSLLKHLRAALFAALALLAPQANAKVVTYHHNDLSVSPIASTWAGGGLLFKENYQPYGSRRNGAAGPYTDRAFAGQTQVKPDLIYMGGRYYEPVLARFLSIDPKEADPSDLHSLNRYAYANNNPYRYVDPDGYTPVDLGFFAIDAVRLGLAIYTGGDVAGAAVDLGMSAVGVLSPVPGAGQALKALRTADKVVEGARAADHVVDAAKGAAETTTVIGRVKDLKGLGAGEKSLLDRLPNLGNPKANWQQNSGVLREEMRLGKPIRDASPGDTAGQFLNAERGLLRDRGWTFDPKTNFWNPPVKP